MDERMLFWYRGRGILLTLLCGILFFSGAYLTNQRSAAVSSRIENRELPVYCVETDRKQAALTFDAAWGNEHTDILLKILEKYQVKATFFVTGTWADAYPEDVKKIAGAGHDIGNHSQNHKDMSELSTPQIREEIQAVHQKVKNLTGQDMVLFRAPYGAYNDNLIRTVRLCGYTPVQWDVDSEDWKNYGVDSIIQKVTQNSHLGNGSIILMHNGAEQTAAALETIILQLKEQGYELVPVSELLILGSSRIDQEGRQLRSG